MPDGGATVDEVTVELVRGDGTVTTSTASAVVTRRADGTVVSVTAKEN